MIGLRLFQPLPGETFSVLFSALNSKIYFKEGKNVTPKYPRIITNDYHYAGN